MHLLVYVKNIQLAIHRHFSQMSRRLEVNNVKYYSILHLPFWSVYFQAVVKKAEINTALFAVYFSVEIKTTM